MTSPPTSPRSKDAGAPFSAYQPVRLDVDGRPVPLEIKVSAPVDGDRLPVLLFSHGHGASMFLSSFRGYGPLVDDWAAHGFVVVQPTHLDSTALGLREADHPESPLYWRSRAKDMTAILDRLDEVERIVPGLAGRTDRSRVAVAGHSMGGHTACLLLGMRTTDPVSGEPVDLEDERIATGAVLAAPGSGEDLAGFASTNYPVFRHSDFSMMRRPALVVAGDRDLNPMFSDRLDYRSDAYTRSPGPKHLLTVTEGEHMLGGVSGWDAAETTDEDPARVEFVRRSVHAYLRSALYPDDPSWDDAVAELARDEKPLGRIESK